MCTECVVEIAGSNGAVKKTSRIVRFLCHVGFYADLFTKSCSTGSRHYNQQVREGLTFDRRHKTQESSSDCVLT